MITLNALELEVAIDAGSVDLAQLEAAEQAAYRRLERAKAAVDQGPMPARTDYEIQQMFDEIRKAREAWRVASWALERARGGRL